MKNILTKSIVLTTCALLLCALPAWAADYSKMSLDVPAGWTVMDQGDTLTIYSADMSSTVTITVSNANGVSAQDYAAQAARNGGLGAPQASGSGFLLQNNAAPGAWVFITASGSKLIVANMMGDRSLLLPVASSVKPK